MDSIFRSPMLTITKTDKRKNKRDLQIIELVAGLTRFSSIIYIAHTFRKKLSRAKYGYIPKPRDSAQRMRSTDLVKCRRKQKIWYRKIYLAKMNDHFVSSTYVRTSGESKRYVVARRQQNQQFYTSHYLARPTTSAVYHNGKTLRMQSIGRGFEQYLINITRNTFLGWVGRIPLLTLLSMMWRQ